MKELSIVGSSPPRVDALEKVTGEAMFTADYKTPGMFHLKVVKSPHPHAKIRHIDTSEAEKLFGVRGIVRPEDAPHKREGLLLKDHYILPCDGIVRFVGEPVVLVAADTPDIAEEAAELVRIDYEELPAVFDLEEAIKKDPPTIIHPERTSYVYVSSPRYPKIIDPDMPNLMTKAFLYVGDVDKGLKECDLIVENKYEADSAQNCPLETHIADAWFDVDGTLTVRSSRQGYYPLQRELSEFFNIPISKVRIIGPYVGGAFGSKISIVPELIVTLAALRLGKAVRLQYTREEDLTTGGRRAGIVLYLKHGVKKDGTLVALEARIIIDGGAYGGFPVLPRTAVNGVSAVYRLPNVKVDAYAVYTNHPPSSPMRGVLIPEVTWAVEQQMDIIAEKLGIDPVVLRMKNILNEGEENPAGEVSESIGVRECLEKVSQWIEWGKKPVPEGNWVKGKGVGIGGKPVGLGYSASSKVKVCRDGAIKLYYGSSEMGQGSHTAMAQIAAEEFKVPVSKVKVVYGDTEVTSWDFNNQASRGTVCSGHAVIRACHDAKEKIFKMAAPKMGLAPEDLDIADGRVYCKDFPSSSIPISDLFTAAGIVKGAGEIVGQGEFTSSTSPMNPKTGRFEKPYIWSFLAYAAEIGVNPETGEVKVFRIVGALDMGQPINTKMCEQQIDGGMGMGIGTTLYEALVYDHGKLLNPDFVNYKIPTAAEIPTGSNWAAFTVKCPHREGPYGAKGFSEAVLVGVAAALSNALYDATGVRLYHIPLTRDRVLEAITQSRGKGG